MDIGDKILSFNKNWLEKRKLLPLGSMAIDEDLFSRLRWDKGSLFLEPSDGGEKKLIGSREGSARNVEAIPTIGPMEYCYTFGFDDGLYIQKVVQKLPHSSMVVCIEPHPEIFYKACEQNDLTELLSSQKFCLVLGSKPDNVQLSETASMLTRFEKLKELQRPEPWLLSTEMILPLKKRFQKEALASLKMMQAVRNTSAISLQHSLANIANSLRHCDPNHLKQAISGRPYIAVGMGPSLSTQIELLKKVQGRAFIAATDNSLKELLHHGIHPDIVFHVEWRDESKEFYKDLKLEKDSVLCYTQGTNAEVLGLWPSQIVAYPSTLMFLLFPEHVQAEGWQSNLGATVGDFALQFGVQCLASEVYMVGYDACFPTGSYCHPNNSSMREIYQEVHRFWSPERWDWGYYKYNFSDKIELEGWDGQPVYSMGSFKRSLDVVRILKGRCKEGQKIYATSEYGAKYEAELGSLERLMFQPEFDKTLHPAQQCIKGAVIRPVLQMRKKEISRYYRLLKEFSLYLNGYLESYGKSGAEVKVTEKTYLERLEAFQSHCDRFAWLEQLFVIIDNSLGIRSSRDFRRRADLNEHEVVHLVAQDFAQYIKSVEPLKDVLLQQLSIVETAFSND